MVDSPIPSLFEQRDDEAAGPGRPMPLPDAATLPDLLYSGFHMIVLLRNGSVPESAEAFRERLRQFLAGFERGGKRLGASSDDVYWAKFAYCALVDEAVLMSQSALRSDWERRPLQLELFGEQLAGERFFEQLERLREEGATRLQLLKVFHRCLLMGFQGRYIVEGSEKLGYLTSRVGDEIARHKGRAGGFAPHWAAPDRIRHTLRHELPLGAICSVFALLGLLGFLGLRWTLERQTAADLAAYAPVVTPPPEAAHVTITWP